MFAGAIEGIRGQVIRGWMYTAGIDAYPLLLVDGYPAQLLAWPVHRADMAAQPSVASSTGFQFLAPRVSRGTHLQLFAASEFGVVPIAESRAVKSVGEPNDLASLHAIDQISSTDGAIGIVCWDGAHNPIGRAKVLYDIAASRSAAAIITYLHPQFGDELWAPVRHLDIPILAIPWPRRDEYHAALRHRGITFDTIWMCKPRLPTFQLAAQLSHADTALVLDIDDNEAHFSSSTGSQMRVYGGGAINLSAALAEKIPARTCASITLSRDFQGEMVRHARQATAEPTAAPARSSTAKVIGFVGTVRPHKGILDAAHALNLYNQTQNTQHELHVFGDVSPPELQVQLRDAGVVVGGMVPAHSTPKLLEQFDVVLAGFPSSSAADRPITMYQISSKIGDALAAHRPVMVPSGESVEDLRDTPGVFLFSRDDFGEQLAAALAAEGVPSLPDDFTIEGAYRGFEAAVATAVESPRAGTALATVAGWQPAGQAAAQEQSQSLLLVWKQQDAGLYGRRVDQIARSYKARYPERNVVVLELCQTARLEDMRTRATNFFSDAALLEVAAAAKLADRFTSDEGVRYVMVQHDADAELPQALSRFLLTNDLRPDNTLVVLFPLLRKFLGFSDVFRGYGVVVDVVDNNLAWAASSSSEGLAQYAAMAALADAMVFNSTSNRRTFTEQGLLNLARTSDHFIDNWYSAPSGVQHAKGSPREGFHIVYSGNMSDRIDWPAMRILADVEGATLHLFGSAERSSQALLELCQAPNVLYYGPVPERELYPLLFAMDLAVMPHQRDRISAAMNPLKVAMYASAGLHCVALDVPGVTGDAEHLTLCADRITFVEAVVAAAQRKRSQHLRPRQATPLVNAGSAEKYLSVLESVLDARRTAVEPATNDGTRTA